MSSVGEGHMIPDVFMRCINATWKQNRNDQREHKLRKCFQTFVGNPEDDQGSDAV